MRYNFIKTRQEGNVFILTLARPEKRNAFTPTMVSEMAHALGDADTDKSVFLIEIRAEGPVFCAGMDLNAFQDPSLDKKNPHLKTDPDLSLGSILEKLNTPTLCVIEGNVYAGGFMIFLGCTFVLAEENVQFSLPEVKLGIFPFQVMAALKKHLSPAQVLKLCIDTRPFSVEKAIELGLVDDFYAEAKLEELSKTILSGSPFAISKGIRALREMEKQGPEEQYAFLKKELEELKKSKDAQIGLKAWKDKTDPKWENE